MRRSAAKTKKHFGIRSRKSDISMEDRIQIMSAIASHDESTGSAFDALSAALILADKTDVRRNRFRLTANGSKIL